MSTPYYITLYFKPGTIDIIEYKCKMELSSTEVIAISKQLDNMDELLKKGPQEFSMNYKSAEDEGFQRVSFNNVVGYSSNIPAFDFSNPIEDEDTGK